MTTDTEIRLPSSFPGGIDQKFSMHIRHTGAVGVDVPPPALDNFRFTPELAITYGLPFTLCGAVNQIYVGLDPSTHAAKFFMDGFGLTLPMGQNLFPVLGTLCKWVVNEQSEALRDRLDYAEAQSFFRQLASGLTSFEDIPWGDFHQKKAQKKGGLLSDMLYALSLDQAAWLKPDQTESLGSSAIGTIQKTLATAAERSNDPQAFYQNCGDVLVQALQKLDA